MEYQEAKDKFIHAWGTLGSSWGINRTMSQIHALLLISPNSLSTEEIMQELNISRGNTNMNVRALMDWGIVEKELKPGERKEFFAAKKDIWLIGKQITKERKKRELDPILEVLDELNDVEGSTNEAKEFRRMMNDLADFATQVNTLLEMFANSKNDWMLKLILKMKR